MTPRRYAQAAAIVRDRITAGTLRPGEPAPSGAELARITGYAALTCRRVLRALIADGTLTEAPAPTHALACRTRQRRRSCRRRLRPVGRARRPPPHRKPHPDRPRRPRRSLGHHVGHAETGRTWQARQFWENCHKALNACGALLRLHDAYRAATTADRALAVKSNGDTHMDDYLRKRMLAVNVLLEVPDDIPDGLESELYSYRDKLEAEALSA